MVVLSDTVITFPLNKQILTDNTPFYFHLNNGERKCLPMHAAVYIIKSGKCLRCSKPYSDLDHLFICYNIEENIIDALTTEGRHIIGLGRIWKSMNGVG